MIGGEQGTEVSLQLLQSIYNEITGKTEKLSKRYETAFRIDLDDLRQLHNMIKQLCEQYNIKSENESVTVFYEEDTRNVFSSFARFLYIDPSSLSAVESISLVYNFLVIVPKTKRPQTYKLSIQLESRVVQLSKLNNSDLPRGLVTFVGKQTAMVSVEYVDYLIAKNLSEAFDRWIKGLPDHKNSKWFTFVRKHSYYLRQGIRYSLGAFGAYIIFGLVPHFIPTSNPDFQVLSNFVILGLLSIFLLFRLGYFFGRQVEDAIDDSLAVSYIKINRGDDKQIRKAERNKWKQFSKFLFGSFGSITLGIVSTYVAKWLMQ